MNGEGRGRRQLLRHSSLRTEISGMKTKINQQNAQINSGLIYY